MKRSWLIQRMKKPTGSFTNFAFGGGGSGFSEENAKGLSQICSWDYMGASEYEFGAPANSMNRMASNKDEFVANLINTVDGTVFYLCPNAIKDEVEQRITKWAGSEETGTRDTIYLWEILHNVRTAYMRDCCGWFDIENDFMFFTDEKMWRSFSQALDIIIPSKKKVRKLCQSKK